MFATVPYPTRAIRYLSRMTRFLDDDPLIVKLRRASGDLRNMQHEVDACAARAAAFAGCADEDEWRSLQQRVRELYGRATHLLMMLDDA
ncbi:MAG TPA: hypothetical protein VGF48_14770 [Thermoanaerobaculia bacterium]|jgi:hypothetical protein